MAQHDGPFLSIRNLSRPLTVLLTWILDCALPTTKVKDCSGCILCIIANLEDRDCFVVEQGSSDDQNHAPLFFRI